MNVAWAPHANTLFQDVLIQIAEVLSIEDAYRWRERIITDVGKLADFPRIGTLIPHACFSSIPANADRLRQTFCGPYRIVYEEVENEVHILSIRHSRMLVAEGDEYWH